MVDYIKTLAEVPTPLGYVVEVNVRRDQIELPDQGDGWRRYKAGDTTTITIVLTKKGE